MPDPRDKTLLHMDERQRVPQTRDVSRQGIIPKINGGNGMTGQYNSMRSSEAPSSQMGFLGNSYSPWSLDHIRRKSPERVLNPPPTRRIEEPQRRIITREYENPRIENPRTMVYSSRDSGEISRPMGPFLTKPPLSGGPVKSLPPPSLPPGTNLQRSQYPVKPPPPHLPFVYISNI